MVFSTLNQTFAFHSSPENFISTRLQEIALNEPELLSSRGKNIAQASILNRNVHIVSSYVLCKDILQSDGKTKVGTISASDVREQIRPDTFAVGPAYRELMLDWFPAPNILMEDGLPHAEHKKKWKEQLSTLPTDAEPIVRNIAKSFIKTTLTPGASLDLYESLKCLSWELLLGVILNVNKNTDASRFCKVETAHENLLRGQFSLFPVSINTMFWQSPRSKGFKARQELQKIFSQHISQQNASTCPLLRQNRVDKDDISSHCLLFTSSIANKALSSLLTATLANIFLMPGGQSLASILRSQTGQSRESTMRSILLETERLSPPVIGVMRRVQQDVVLSTPNDAIGDHVPSGHDVWLYLAGANRDAEIFEDAENFHFDRFMHVDEEGPLGFAFGAGPKTCLGIETVRAIVAIVAEEFIDSGIDLDGVIAAEGVRGWLGWDDVSPKATARDLKQLPCQRPRNPIMVTVRSI